MTPGRVYSNFLFLGRFLGAEAGPVVESRYLGHQAAAVHRHSLDRLNAINDSLK